MFYMYLFLTLKFSIQIPSLKGGKNPAFRPICDLFHLRKQKNGFSKDQKKTLSI